VTIVAMGCQRAIAQQIIEGQSRLCPGLEGQISPPCSRPSSTFLATGAGGDGPHACDYYDSRGAWRVETVLLSGGMT